MRYTTLFIIALAVVFLASCASRKNSEGKGQTVQIENVKWQLVELNGVDVPETVNGKTPFVELRSAEKRYAANGGCNGIGGTYEISGNTIKFSQGFSTKMACENMEVEMALIKLFPTVSLYAFDAENLLLKDREDNTIAKLKKMDESK